MLSSWQQFNVRNTVLKISFVFHCINFKISIRKTSLFYWVYLKFSDVKNQYGKEYMTKLVYLKFKTLILRQVWPFLSVPIINIICTKWSSIILSCIWSLDISLNSSRLSIFHNLNLNLFVNSIQFTIWSIIS